MVFSGLYPGRVGAVRGAPRRGREAPPERLVVHLRAGELDRARLRLPLRLPRPPAHGDRAGAARARVRPDAHHDRADRRLPRRTRPTATALVDRQPGEAAAAEGDRAHRGAVHPRHDPPADRVPRQRARALRGAARRADGAHATSARRASCSTYELPLDRDRPRLLRPPEVDDARLRLARLRVPRLPPVGAREARHPHQRRRRRRALRDRPPRPRLLPRPRARARSCAS